MKGFGDPVEGGLGFGDPEPLTLIQERGFGDPEDIDLYTIDLETRIVYHTGGAEVIIRGVLFQDLAPYRAEIMVNNTALFCHSGEAGQGAELYPLRDEIYCYTPPAPVGVYPLILRFGLNFSQSASLSVEFVADNRGAERYRLRSLFPSHYNTGPRASSLDPLDVGATVEEEGPLALLLDTAGRIFQEIAGVASTVTRARAERGALRIELESVLGFAEEGEAWINRERIAYSLDSSQNALIVEALKRAVPIYAEVTHHVI